MTSSRPYLLKAIYNWLIDNQLTPYLLVDAEYQDVVVPDKYIQDGKIILNIAYPAIEMLDIKMDSISFSARFSGKSMHIYIPMQAVLALYAMENGKGMVFPEEQEIEEQAHQQTEVKHSMATSTTNDKDASRGKTDKVSRPSFLKVVK